MIGSVITVLSDFNAQHMHMLQSDVCRLSVCLSVTRWYGMKMAEPVMQQPTLDGFLTRG